MRVRWLVGAVVATAALVGAPQTSIAATYRLGIVAVDFRFAGIPSSLPAGEYDVQFFNGSRVHPHEAVAFDLGPECANYNRAQVIALLDQPEADAFIECPNLAFEGFTFAEPLGRDRQTYNLVPGRTFFACFIDTGGTPHFKLGLLSIVNVRVA
ncbi:MAG: hypothetical protein ABR540_06585 [Acidimicrobiales bacterium]